jgi:aminoglycoside phosphotransferase (APT) family kinase protein
MSETESKWQADVHLMMCHPVEPAVLLLYHTGVGWALPQMKLEDDLWVRPETALSDWVLAQWGMPAITLHCAGRMVDRDKQYVEAIFALEARSVKQLPENGHFFTRSDLATLTLARPEQRKVLEAYLNDLESGVVSPLRPPWLRRGWFDRASRWMAAELERLGYRMTGPVEELSSWVLSSVLRVTTAEGLFYMKAVPDWPLFVHEPLFLARLSRLCPGHVPAPLSVEPAERWMLLADFGTAIWRDGLAEYLPEMVRAHAQLQAKMAEHVPVLFEIGCIDRRLGRLAAQLDELLADEAAMEGLEAAEIAQLHEATPRLKAICAELSAYRVPQTLMHGDLHPGNVASLNGQMIFFDWTDACIAHPFLDMMVIFEETDEAKRKQLLDVYLEQWTAYEPVERLLEAWRLAEPLWALHQAVSYQTILANLEEVPRMGFSNVIPAYLREVLKNVGSRGLV